MTTSTAHAQANMTDEGFREWLLNQFKAPRPSLYADYPEIFEAGAAAITKWRQRYRGDPALWKRLFDKEQVRKEFTEAVPIIDAVVRLVRNEDKKYTVVDLASGKGYLSMLLSEMLPPSKVEKFILMDKAWAAHNVTPQPHHMNSEHIYGKYYHTWPIPLVTSKQDLKSGRQRRNLQKLFLQANEGQNPPHVILLGVHLCGILSLRAVDLFNHNPSIEFFCLKPCCLPGIMHAKRKEWFNFTREDVSGQDVAAICPPCHHSFDAKTVCMPGRWNKNVWRGPHRSILKNYFVTWAENLFLGIGIDQGEETKETTEEEGDDATTDSPDKYQQGPMATKLQKTVLVQTEGGYQNEFLFAQRNPTTNAVWEKLTATTTNNNT